METYMFSIPPVVSVAFEVLAGKYGVDAERRKNLEKKVMTTIRCKTVSMNL